uniref:Membrane protein, putative n=1 Tax=Babesia bovis TaxID=5865 RepID=A7APF2_BABBO|eukprot:XP_001612004.1 membrane protein [Babesia bovis T2Bo]
MERGLRNFIIIIAMDVIVFVSSVIVWCHKRSKIIDLVRNGLQGLPFLKSKKNSAKLPSKDMRKASKILEHAMSTDIECSDGDIDSYSDVSNCNSDMKDEDESATNWSLYVSLAKSRKKTKVPIIKSTVKEGSWWYYLLYGKHDNIRNNEAVLYLKFVRSTCIMLCICSVVSVVSNIVMFTHLAINNKPQFLFTYSFEDMRRCKVTVWTLYATVWIYSFIVYIHILKFRRKVNRGKQITVMLRPQLHTIMICGFDKNITDPIKFYKHFEKYFPEHVLAVHIVYDHSKRMLLEEELEATKAQLCLCRDMSFLLQQNRKTKNDSSKTHSYEEVQEPKPSTAKPRRSRSCSDLPSKGQNDEKRETIQELRASLSSTNLVLPPTEAKRESPKPSSNFGRGVVRQITRFIAGNASVLQSQQGIDSADDFGEHFAGLLKKVKELKEKIQEEVNATHSTSAKVCFVSFADSNIVMHILRDRNILEAMPEWRIRPAPHPRDIIWKHLHIPRYVIFLKMVGCNLLLVSFYIVVTWVLSHLNLLQTVKSRELADAGATSGFSINDLTERSFWSALMPPLVMATLNTCVHPSLINLFSKKIGVGEHYVEIFNYLRAKRHIPWFK